MCLCGSILIIPVTVRSAPHASHEALLPRGATPVPANLVVSDQPFMVLAQAGSSGGTIGKRGRSVSGSEPEAKTRSLDTGTRSHRRSGSRGTRSYVRARGNCVSGSFAGYSGRVCY